MNPINFSKGILFLFFFAATSLLAYMAWSFKDAIIFAVILAALFYPLHDWFQKKCNFTRQKSSLLMCTFITFMVILPASFMISRLSLETYNLYTKQKYIFDIEYIKSFLSADNLYLNSLNETLSIVNLKIDLAGVTDLLVDNAQELSAFIFSIAQSWITGTFSVTFSFFFQFIIMMCVVYSLFISGSKIKKFLFVLWPLTEHQEDILLEKLQQMNYVTFVCNGLGGLLQGGLAAIGFYLAGIEPVLLWGFIMMLLAFIPLLGISLVYVPACVYLITQQSYLAAILLFIYCTLVALTIENIYKPKFIGKRVKVDSMLLLMSIIGGLASFGVFGIFYGPLILTVYLSLFDFLTEEITENMTQT